MHNRHTPLIIAYFAGLAVFMGVASTFGKKPDMGTVISGMVVIAAIGFLLWLIFKLVQRPMRQFGYSWKQWLGALFGADADVIEAMPGSGSVEATTALVPYGSTEIVPYEVEDEEDWSTFIEPDGLDLSDVFRPSVHSLLGQQVAVFGIRRAGKSNCISVMIETLASYYLPMLICDTKDEYAGLVNPKYLPHGWMAGASGATANVPEEARYYYIPLDEEGAVEFGKNLMEGHWQVVLNLKSYETDEEAARVMCGIIKGINAWQEARPNREREPVEIVLDEGHKWLPQNESNELSKDVQSLLHKTFFSTIVRLGGANGFGFIVASQRISELDKRCLQSSWKFLFKQSETIDLKKYEEYNLRREDVLSLNPGECFVFSPSVLGFRVRMHRKHSPDLSMTPGLDQITRRRKLAHARQEMLARRHSYSRQSDPPFRSDGDAPGISATAPRLSALEAPPEMEPLTVVEFPRRDAALRKRLTEDQEKVLEQWNQGLRTHREIAAALGKSESAVYTILNQLDIAGYIQRKKRTSANA